MLNIRFMKKPAIAWFFKNSLKSKGRSTVTGEAAQPPVGGHDRQGRPLQEREKARVFNAFSVQSAAQ